MLFVGKALLSGPSIRVCQKVNMPFVAFSGLLEIYRKHCFTEFVSNYCDQEAVKISKYTDGIARIKGTHYQELSFRSVDAHHGNQFFSFILFSTSKLFLELCSVVNFSAHETCPIAKWRQI